MRESWGQRGNAQGSTSRWMPSNTTSAVARITQFSAASWSTVHIGSPPRHDTAIPLARKAAASAAMRSSTPLGGTPRYTSRSLRAVTTATVSPTSSVVRHNHVAAARGKCALIRSR